MKKFLSNRGAALLEFALIAPFLITLLMVAFESVNLMLLNNALRHTALTIAHALSLPTITVNNTKCANTSQIIGDIPKYTLGRFNKLATVEVFGLMWGQMRWQAFWQGLSGVYTVNIMNVTYWPLQPIPAGAVPAGATFIGNQEMIMVRVTYTYKPLFRLLYSTQNLTAFGCTYTQTGDPVPDGNCPWW